MLPNHQTKNSLCVTRAIERRKSLPQFLGLFSCYLDGERAETDITTDPTDLSLILSLT